jgi:hemerythrin superfamily protein
MMAKSVPSDAIALLKADHRKVEDLFANYEAARSDSKKKALAGQICLELTVHTKIEEDIFYPACKGEIDDDLWHEAYVEHDGAKVMIAEIEQGNPGDEFYDAKVKVLSEMIKHHVREEEKRAEGMFAQAKAAGLDVDALGEQLAREKKALVAQYKASGVPKPPTPSFTGTKLA